MKRATVSSAYDRERPSSGIAGLDGLLHGLFAGDNVVWVADGGCRPALTRIFDAFLRQGAEEAKHRTYVRTSDGGVRPPGGSADRVLDARRGALADPITLEQAIIDQERPAPGRVVFDDLDGMVDRWGRDETLGFFTRVCPQLFDIGSIAYWAGTGTAVAGRLLDQITRATQCVLQLRDGRLRVVKSEGRIGIEGRVVRIVETDDGGLELEQERTLGRLAEGLRRIRKERGLSQSEVAALANVSASAISQAESGQRGLALDTVVGLAEALEVSVDELVATRTTSDYVVRRRDRSGVREGLVPLIDDPSAGLRAYLITLGPGESAAPPALHKGSELVLVAAGLVQVDLGTAAPVMRVGDAVLATKVPIVRWTNLLAKPAALYWVLRD